MHQRLKAFVIMPFEPEFDSIYQTLIKEPLEEAGFEVSRADSFLGQRNILSDIVRGITAADLVVADLTATNANVFYELGLSHGLGIPTILIAQSINDVPFDLRSYRIQIYETHFDKIGKLRDDLKDIAIKHKSGAMVYGNPVTDFSTAATHAKESIDISKPSEELSEDVEEKGLLDYLAEGEQSSKDLTAILTKLTKDNGSITNKFKKHTISMQALASNPTAGSAGKFHKLSLLVASDINAFSNRVEASLPLLESAIDRMDENFLGYVEAVDVNDSQILTQLTALHQSIGSLLDNAKKANLGMSSYRSSVIEMRERNISKDLTRATRRQAQALEGITSNIDRVEAFCGRMLTMINNKISKANEGTPGELSRAPFEEHAV